MRIRELAPDAEAHKIQGKTVVAARTVVLAAIAALALIPAASAQQASSATNGASAAPAPADSLAAAARRAKEEKKHDAKPARVFTNDNMPASGGVSTVGSAPNDADASSSNKSATSTSAARATPAQGETYWRDKFDKLNTKLQQDQSELDVMQRELGQLNLQNYSDPNKAMQQGYSHSDIDKKTAQIDAKQKEIDADKQAISDAQDDLRKSGGDPGWAR